jgi:hypothetical protein
MKYYTGRLGARLAIFLALLFVAGIVVSVGAQEQDLDGTVPGDDSGLLDELQDEAGPGLVIDEITWEIHGRTRLWVLKRLLTIEEGLRFTSEQELVLFLLDQQQELINRRELHTSTIEYTITDDGRAERDGVVPEEAPGDQRVRVDISVTDTWNIIALPYARYDSNEGLLLSIRVRDYNFFGTLQDLRIDLDYEFTDEGDNVVTLSTDFSLPFEMLRREWALVLKQSLGIQDGDVDFQLGVGLEYYFDWIGMDWTAAVTQEYRYLSDRDDEDGYYLANKFALGSGINLPVHLPGFGRLRYSPEVNSGVNYRPGGISEDREGVTVGFDHDISAGRFNWIGNYRDGRIFLVGNDNQYNITRDTWDNEIYGRISTYRALWRRPDPAGWPRAGVSSSLSAYYLPDGADEDQDNAAQDARGILNDRMNGDVGVFLNTDAAFTLWTLKPVFEMQVGTFLDVAYVRDTRGDFHESTSFDRKRDLKFGGGISVVGFPLFARSLFIRGSYGVDLDLVIDEGVSPLAGKAREIFIGLGHHY